MFQLASDSKTTVFPFPSTNQPSPNSYRTFSFINKASWCPRCGFPRFPSSLPCISAGSPLQFPTGTVCLPTSRRLSSILLTNFFPQTASVCSSATHLSSLLAIGGGGIGQLSCIVVEVSHWMISDGMFLNGDTRHHASVNIEEGNE